MFFFFFKQKTAYEMRISDWSSDVCSSDLQLFPIVVKHCDRIPVQAGAAPLSGALAAQRFIDGDAGKPGGQRRASLEPFDRGKSAQICALHRILGFRAIAEDGEGGSKQALVVARGNVPHRSRRSEEHTSELQSLMRISYAVFCLTKKKKQ